MQLARRIRQIPPSATLALNAKANQLKAQGVDIVNFGVGEPDFDTPDNINFILNYPQKVNVTFEATITDMLPEDSADIVFFGEGGRLNIFRHRARFLPANRGPAETLQPGPDPPHMGNFLACVRSRQTPNANVVDGHYGSMACHIGNIAYKEGRRVMWDPRWDV